MIIRRIYFKSLRLGLRLLYNQFAWAYDLVASVVSAGHWKEWVLSTLPHLHGPLILEIGHGPGYLLQVLRSKGFQAIGIDASWAMSLRGLRLLGGGINNCVVNGYAQFLPFSTAYFDNVVMTFPAEYISYPNTLAEIHRVLKNGGTLTILPFVKITGSSWIDFFASRLLRITGEPPKDWEALIIEPFVKAGFSTRITQENVENCTAFFIHATKQILPM